MQTASLWHNRHIVAGISLLMLVFMLSACSFGGGNSPSSSNSTPTNTTSGGTNATSTATPSIQLGVQHCPAAIASPTHWDPILATQSGVSQVDSVTCGNLIGVTTLQALVTVRYSGSGSNKDVYVYNKITDASPQQLFKLQGLSHGDAKISGYNTILTAEVDQNSSVNKNAGSNAGLTQDLFREFKWSDGAGTLVPVGFPGLFPDLTRFQAEADQNQVNQGQQVWKLDAGMVANTLAVTMLHCRNNAATTIVSGGGAHDVNAVVSVKSPKPGSGTIKVTMSRLEGNANGGIWEATTVDSDGMAITSPQDIYRFTSPFSPTP